MTTDTKLSELIINTLSPEQFEPITPSETELYLVEDNSEYATIEELSTKQDVLTAGNGIDITNNKISTNTQFVITEDMFDLEFDDTKGVAPYNTSYGYTNITIHDNAGVEWVEGASYTFVLDTKVSTSVNRNVRVRIGESGDWKPLMLRSGAIAPGVTYFIKAVNIPFQYSTKYQTTGALHIVEYNTTYSINYSFDNGQHTGGVGAYAITRYSLCMQKPDMTWEKITNTSKNYTTSSNKTVNKTGFLLNHIRYYGTTTNIANGALITNNVMYTKSSTIDASYSFNCSTTPNWGVGKQVYILGTVKDDGLFYLDENQWWSVELPTSNDGKLYIRIGLTLNATNSTISFLDDRPIVYHDGTGIKEYIPHDYAKQDVITDLDTIRSNAELGATALQEIPEEYIKNTDYATTDTAGVIRPRNIYGTSVTGNGYLAGATRTNEQYKGDSDALIISKSTLENIKENLVTSVGDTKYQPIIEDLDEIRTNAETGAGLSTQVESNTQRIEELATSKLPNATPVGTPHIVGSYVSNFSDTSYMLFPFTDISRGYPFDIYFSFTTSDDITTQQNILDSYFGIALAIKDAKGIMSLSSNGTNWDIGTSVGTNLLSSNTTYYVKYSWTGEQYNASISTNKESYVPDMILNSTLSPHKTTIYIGGSPNLFGAGSAHPFKGTINFKDAKVVVQGIDVWDGYADVGFQTRANVSLSNLDEAGEYRFSTKQDVTDYGLATSDKTIVGAINEINSKASVPDLDETTINLNDTNKLQAIGVIDKNKGDIKYDWIGTQSEWKEQNIAEEHPEWLCYITDDYAEDKAGNSGFEVGDIGVSLFVDESKGLRRYLNGSLLGINSNTQGFLDRLTKIQSLHPSIVCTESEWQAIATMSVYGQCGKFVIDETAGTIRLPRIVMPIQGLTDLSKLGEMVEQGLPNITGDFSPAIVSSHANYCRGAFSGGNGGFTEVGTRGIAQLNPTGAWGYSFNAHNSNATYKDGANVQQEQVQYPYFIQIATGQETQVDIINTIELNNPYSLLDSKYSEYELKNLSWLKSEGQWNDGNTYTGTYELLVKLLNGTETIEGISVKAVGDSSITDYDFVVDMVNVQFRLPLLDGSESMITDQPTLGTLGLPQYPLSSGADWVAPFSGVVFLRATKYPDAGNTLSISRNTHVIASAPAWNVSFFNYSFSVTKGDVVKVATDGASNNWQVTLQQFYRYKGNGTLYFYVGETTQNANLIDAGRIAEQLTNKVDTDSSWGFPSSRYIDLTFGAGGTLYTAPANGWFYLQKGTTAVNQVIVLTRKDGNADGMETKIRSGTSTGNYSIILPCSKNDVMRLDYSFGGATVYFRFYYAEGAE